MGSGIAHMITPVSAAWSSWTMFLLLLCAVLSEVFQPGVITQAHVSLFARSDRNYKESPTTFMGQFLVSLFRIGTLAMALCLSLYTEGHFSLGAYIAVCGLILAILLVKMLCNAILDFTFMLTRRNSVVYEHYANIATIVTVFLYPITLVLLRIGSPVAGQWILGIVSLLFIAMWVYRGGRMLISSPMAVLYFAVYMCTLEILPLAVLYVSSAKLITII